MLKFETYKIYRGKIQHAKIESDPRADTMISRIDGEWTVDYNLLKTVDRTWRLCPAFISTTYSGNVARGTRCLVFHERHIAGSSILTTLEILYRAIGILYFVWCIPSSFLFTFLSLWNIFLNFFLTLEPPRLIKKISKIISQRI